MCVFSFFFFLRFVYVFVEDLHFCELGVMMILMSTSYSEELESLSGKAVTLNNPQHFYFI